MLPANLLALDCICQEFDAPHVVVSIYFSGKGLLGPTSRNRQHTVRKLKCPEHCYQYPCYDWCGVALIVPTEKWRHLCIFPMARKTHAYRNTWLPPTLRQGIFNSAPDAGHCSCDVLTLRHGSVTVRVGHCVGADTNTVAQGGFLNQYFSAAVRKFKNVSVRRRGLMAGCTATTANVRTRLTIAV